MTVIDCEALMSSADHVKGGFVRRGLNYFHSTETTSKTEEEMIADWRNADVKAILHIPTLKCLGWGDFGDIKAYHEYAGYLRKKYPDIVLGGFVCIDPDWGWKALAQIERCIADYGLYGICVAGALTGVPANDRTWYPYYSMALEAKVPVKIWVGTTGALASTREASAIRLGLDNPLPYVDDVAGMYPDLNIVCHHMPWPFHDEMAAVLVHKTNVYCELHGWRPRYYPATFKHEMNTRIQDKILFGSDYPMWNYQKLFREFADEGYKPEVLEKLYFRNAQRLFGIEL